MVEVTNTNSDRIWGWDAPRLSMFESLGQRNSGYLPEIDTVSDSAIERVESYLNPGDDVNV